MRVLDPPTDILSPHLESLSESIMTAHRSYLISAPRHIATLAFVAIALLALWPTLTSAQLPRRRPAANAMSTSCLAPEPIVAQARIDRDHVVYVEQETVTPGAGGRVLVAGNPVFLWGRNGAGYDFQVQDTLMGMIVSPPSGVHALLSPIPGRSFLGVRSAALPDGWWLLTFAEVVAAQAPVIPRVIAYWAAETDGSRWRSLQKLPFVADSLMLSAEASALVWRDGRALLAVPAEREGQRRVVTFTRERGQWSVTSAYLGLRTYVALAATASRDILAVVRPDTTEHEDDNSLFIYYKAPSDTAWTIGYRLVRGFRSPVRDPLFSEDGDGLRLSWRVTSSDQRSRTAWFTRLSAQGDTLGPNVLVATEAELLYDAARGSRGLWVVSDRGAPTSTMRFVEYDGSSTPSAARVTPTTYRGLVGVAITADYAVVIASQASSTHGVPAVMSIVQSHPWRCH
ncbi:MAG: hypothetical protein JWL95_388 [Gemmatimonadetes bacterium]|nr:hypothetical protein [Gemmatimonadota bacterium]